MAVPADWIANNPRKAKKKESKKRTPTFISRDIYGSLFFSFLFFFFFFFSSPSSTTEVAELIDEIFVER